MGKLLTAVVLVGFIVLSLVSLGTPTSYAGEIDILLQKLVEKGVLTPGEAQQIGTETKEQVKAEIAAGKSSSLPAWVQNTKFKGDFRLRYQYDHSKKLPTTTQPTDQHRARMRLRLGLESKVNEKLLVGVGLSTGLNTNASANLTNKDTSRSPNQTLGEGFGKKPVTLNYAYAKYSPVSWATLLGGKFNNPLWEPMDLIWDTDINPEGAAVTLKKNIFSNTEAFTTLGVFNIDESAGSGSDPTAFIVQSGLTRQFTDNISLKGAVSYYDFSGTLNKKLDGTTGTNSADAGGRLIYDYKDITPSFELGIKEPLKAFGLDLPYLALFGEFVKNLAVNHEDTGYMAGLKLGAEKIEKWLDWKFTYNYGMLAKDSILDILPDSDRYGGKTGIRAHEAILDFGLGKNTWLSFDYYYAWQLPGNLNSTQTKPASVVQVDWNMKW